MKDSTHVYLNVRRPRIRAFIVSLIGAAAVVTGLVILRQQKQVDHTRVGEIPAGETVPSDLSLERLRASGY